MLQSIPDPFDAYGPPQADDQIFSILPPLSIMNVPSQSPSPLLCTPEREAAPALTTPDVAASWEPINGGTFPESGSQWADVHSPSSTPPRSASPPRRHPMPPSSHQPRKSESKLRSVLSIIDEGHSRVPSSEDPAPSSPPALNGNTPSNSDPDTRWDALPYNGTDDTTPRNSILFVAHSKQPPNSDSKNSPPGETPVLLMT